jgi:hypothetical protein
LLDKSIMKFTNSVESSSSNMIVLTLYFEWFNQQKRY